MHNTHLLQINFYYNSLISSLFHILVLYNGVTVKLEKCIPLIMCSNILYNLFIVITLHLIAIEMISCVLI